MLGNQSGRLVESSPPHAGTSAAGASGCGKLRQGTTTDASNDGYFIGAVSGNLHLAVCDTLPLVG